MKTNGNKTIIIIAIVLMLIAIMGGVFAYVYLYTDILKTDQELFAKYINQDFEQIKQIIDTNKFTEMQNDLKENKYEENMSLVLMGEDQAEDIIEVTVDSQVDPTSSKIYANAKLILPDTETVGLEYINENEMYSIRFTNAVQEFISVENTNLKELISKFNVDEEILNEIPNMIDFEKYSLSDFNLTEEEITAEINKYIKLIYNNISKEKYSKNKDVVITIDGSTVTTKSYTLKLNSKDINQITLKLLEEIKKDEVILEKVQILDEKLQDLIEVSLKDSFIQKIEEKINNLNQQAIAEESNITITIYVLDGETIRVKLEDGFESILLDTLTVNKIKLKHNNIDEYNNQKTQEIIITKENENKLNIQNISIEGEEQKSSNYSIELIQNENNINLNMIFENAKNKTSLTRNINIVEYINYKEILDETNNIILNDLSAKQIEIVINFFKENLPKKYPEPLEKALNKFKKMYLINDLIEDVTPNLEKAEISAFNSKFEAYEESNLTVADMNALLNTVLTNNQRERENGTTNFVSVSGDIILETTATKAEKIEGNLQYKVECEYNALGYVSNIIVTSEEPETITNNNDTNIQNMGENIINILETLN